jgi:hypothetical protein
MKKVRISWSSVLECRFAACVMLASSFSIPHSSYAENPLLLDEVLASVQSQYPPYLAALIEQDIANGRVRQAQGAFDVNLNAGGSMNLAGYYDGRTGYAMIEQPLPFWGGSVYSGYRLSSGFLPNYNKDRTGVDGEGVLGFRIPLLRDGTIDRRRASLWQAQIDQELADPIILRQHLDFIRAATIALLQLARQPGIASNSPRNSCASRRIATPPSPSR